MVPKFNPRSTLHSRYPERLCSILGDYILELAVLGYLSEARSLTSLLNTYYPCYHLVSVLLRPLWLIWDRTSWPAGEEAHVDQSLADLAEKQSNYLWMGSGIREDERTYDAGGLQRVMGDLEFSGTHDGYLVSKSRKLVKALEISLVIQNDLGEANHLSTPDQILRLIANRFHAPGQISALAESARCWDLLQGGALALALGLDDQKIKTLSGDILRTFTQRFEKGPQGDSEIENMSIQDLLLRISQNTIANKSAQIFWDESGDEHYPTSLLKDPLPQHDIAQLEERLHVTLPADYKEFLSYSNGLGESWGGILIEPELTAAKDVKWLGHNIEHVALTTAKLLDINIFCLERDETKLQYATWPKADPVIQIGKRDVDEVWLLTPEVVSGVRKAYLRLADGNEKIKAVIYEGIRSFCGSMDKFDQLKWCVIDFSGETTIACSSFRAFLERKAEDSQNENPRDREFEGDFEHRCLAYSCKRD